MSRYDDIIHLPHHVSKVHPQMSIHDRAAQFSPFAALTGHSEAAEETARLTSEQVCLVEDEITELNQKLLFLKHHLQDTGPVRIIWFREDSRKAGGEYLTAVSPIQKIDEAGKFLLLKDDTVIPMQHILRIDI